MEWKGWALYDSKAIFALFEDKRLVLPLLTYFRKENGRENMVIPIVLDQHGHFTCPDWRIL